MVHLSCIFGNSLYSNLLGDCKYLCVMFTSTTKTYAPSVQMPGFSSGGSKSENLHRLSRSNPVIKLTNPIEFHYYLVSLPRDYSAFVLLTERRRTCPECWHAKRNFEAIAQHFNQQNSRTPKIFFFMILLEDMPQLFAKVASCY